MKDKWIKRQLALLAVAKAEGRSLTAAEQAEFDECQRQIEAEEKPPAQGGGVPDGGARGAGGDVPNLDTIPGRTPDVSSLDTIPGNGGADASQRAMEAERRRTADILALCRQTDMEADRYIENGDSLDAVRAAAVEHLLQHGAPVV